MPHADHLSFVAEPKGVRMRGAAGGHGFTLHVSNLGAGSDIHSCAMTDGSPMGFREVPLGRLLGYLESLPDGIAPSAAAAMREMIGRPEAMGILDRWHGPSDDVRLPAQSVFPCWGRDELYLYSGENHRSFLARIVVEGVPNLVRVVPDLMRAHPGTFPGGRGDPLAIVRSCLEVRYPWLAVDEARLARVLALDWHFDSLDVICALLGIPWDWVPHAPADRAAFSEIANGTAALATRLKGRSYLRPARGRWVEYARTLDGHLPGDGTFVERLRGASEGACDMAADFGNQVLLPVIALANPAHEASIILGSRQRLPHLAARTLFGGKGLCAIVDTASEWHRAHGRTAEAIWKLGRATHHWPVPFETAEAPNGLEIAFLGNSEALRAEGASGPRDGTPGLNHCVASYALHASSGDSAVASIRRRRLGVFRRYSTVEFRVDRYGTRVVQHKGRANGLPPKAAAHALEWFLGQVSQGKIRPDPAYLETSWRTRRRDVRTVEDHCGYDFRVDANVQAALDAWAGFLPRPLRTVAALSGVDATSDFVLRDLGDANAGRIVTGRVPDEAWRPPRRWVSNLRESGRILAAAVPWIGAIPYDVGSFLGTLAHTFAFPGHFSQSVANPSLPVQVVSDWPDLRPTRTRILAAGMAFSGGMAVEAAVGSAAIVGFGTPGAVAFAGAGLAAVVDRCWSERAFLACLVKDCRSAWHSRRIRAHLDSRYGQVRRAET